MKNFFLVLVGNVQFPNRIVSFADTPERVIAAEQNSLGTEIRVSQHERRGMQRYGVDVYELEVLAGRALHGFLLGIAFHLLVHSRRDVRDDASHVRQNQPKIRKSLEKPAENDAAHRKCGVVEKSQAGNQMMILHACIIHRMRGMDEDWKTQLRNPLVNRREPRFVEKLSGDVGKKDDTLRPPAANPLKFLKRLIDGLKRQDPERLKSTLRLFGAF